MVLMLFQVADVDSGVINWVNADLVSTSPPGFEQSGVADPSISAR